MTHTPTPAEIETLRKIVNGELDREADYAAIIAANKTLDRLSPPEPDQPDEAREVALAFLQVWYGNHPSPNRAGSATFPAARQVISELIASKDAEIERLTQHAYNVMKTLEISNGKIMELQPELAALRAENERLKAGMKKRNMFYCAECDAYFHGAESWHSCKAAERNTAEPLTPLAPGEPKVGGWTSNAKYAPAPATDTTPEVVVTQDDWNVLHTMSAVGAVTKFNAKLIAEYRTEAEARGRRTALDFGENASELYFKALREKWPPVGFFSELKRMMMEPKS